MSKKLEVKHLASDYSPTSISILGKHICECGNEHEVDGDSVEEITDQEYKWGDERTANA